MSLLQVVPFSFELNGLLSQVRTIFVENEVWFVGVDVATVLDYANPRQAIKDHCKLYKSLKDLGGSLRSHLQDNDLQDTTLMISEGDVYRLLTRSRKPQAEAVAAKIFDELLPALRKGQFVPIDHHRRVVAHLRSQLETALGTPLSALPAHPSCRYDDKPYPDPVPGDGPVMNAWEIPELRPFLKDSVKPSIRPVKARPEGYVSRARVARLCAPFSTDSFFRFLRAVAVPTVWVASKRVGAVSRQYYCLESVEAAWRAAFARRLLRIRRG